MGIEDQMLFEPIMFEVDGVRTIGRSLGIVRALWNRIMPTVYVCLFSDPSCSII